MGFMRKSLLLLILLIFSFTLQAQKDTTNIIGYLPKKYTSEEINFNVTIYPVPVRENNFTIKTDRDISLVKITNIIGQDVFKVKYSPPQQLIYITLDNPKRGMYLVTIIFSDGMRVVKKIMVEESE
jgi:hypothetical protein